MSDVAIQPQENKDQVQETTKTEDPPVVKEDPEDLSLVVKTQFPDWLSANRLVTLSIFVYTAKSEKRIRLINADKLGLEALQIDLNLDEYEIKAQFRVPECEELDRYREMASYFDENVNRLLVRKTKVRRLFIKFCLRKLGWVQPDGTVESFPLVFESRGNKKGECLDKQSVENINLLHPTLVEVLVAKFEAVAALTL